MPSHDSVTLPDGRALAYATYGDPDGDPLVFHHGTPGSHVLGALLDDAARERGVHVVAPSRPGYAASDPLPDGRAWADDCVALADALGVESFAVVGFSGGGPYALRVATALPDRVTAAGVVGSPVPAGGPGPFEPLTRTPRLLGAAFRVAEWLARYRGPDAVVAQFTDETVADGTARVVARDFHAALRSGASGAVRESRAVAGDWSLPAPDCPVTAWHGTDDANVAVGPVRETFADRPGVSFVAVDADHLGALLAVRERVVGLAD